MALTYDALLHQDAMENAPESHPASLRSMREVMAGMMGMEPDPSIKVLGEKDGWYQIEFPADIAYVCGQYVRLNEVATAETPEGYSFDITGTDMAAFLSAFSSLFEGESQVIPEVHGLTPDEQGKSIWEDVKTKVPNKELKGMVEAYKTRKPQTRETQSRESAKEKLDALVKDMAAKLSPEKTPKAKSKKAPEL